MKPQSTLKDISERLGLSKSTVSRALKNNSRISKETRELVIKTAKEMNYHRNPFASSLSLKKSMVIGLVIPEFYNSFFPTVITGIQNVLKKEGYKLLIAQSSESKANEEENLKIFENSMVDGIILCITTEGANDDIYNRIIQKGIPLVFFARYSKTIDAPKVSIDNYFYAYIAVEHLIRSGYKRIAHITGPSNLHITQERKRGYIKALEKYNIPIDESLIVRGDIVMEKGQDAMTQLLQNPNRPDAVFAFNDHCAIGAMQTIKEHGLRIPEDIAMVGFSESHSALIVEPKLTTVAQPLVEIGECAAQLMMDLINDKPIEKKHIILPGHLNVRESSRKSE